MQTTLRLFQNKVVATSSQDADGSSRVLDTSNLDNLSTRVVGLFDQVGITKLVLSESINVGDWLASERLGKELDFITLDILDGKDTETFEEGERSVINSITKNGFLDK